VNYGLTELPPGTASDNVSEILPGISEPQRLLCIPEKNRLLVCSRGDGTCRSFDAMTYQEGLWIDLGRNADNVRFAPEAQIIYVGSGGEPGNGLLSAIYLVSLLPTGQGGEPASPHSPADFLLDRPRQADPRMGIRYRGRGFHGRLPSL
jgi:hypothetical protein